MRGGVVRRCIRAYRCFVPLSFTRDVRYEYAPLWYIYFFSLCMRARICQPLSRIRMRIRIPVNRTTIVKVRVPLRAPAARASGARGQPRSGDPPLSPPLSPSQIRWLCNQLPCSPPP